MRELASCELVQVSGGDEDELRIWLSKEQWQREYAQFEEQSFGQGFTIYALGYGNFSLVADVAGWFDKDGSGTINGGEALLNPGDTGANIEQTANNQPNPSTPDTTFGNSNAVQTFLGKWTIYTGV